MTKDETAEIGPPVCTVYGPRLTPFSPAQLTKLTYYAAECNWACNCGFRCASDYVRRARPDRPARSSAQRGTENGGPDVKVRTPSTCPAGWPRVAAGAGVVTVMALVLAGRCRPVSLPMRCWWPDGITGTWDSWDLGLGFWDSWDYGDMIRIPHINPSTLHAAFSPACPGRQGGRASSRPSR